VEAIVRSVSIVGGLLGDRLLSGGDAMYSDLEKVDTTKLENFQTCSIEWALKTKLFRIDGTTEDVILNEDDTAMLTAKMYVNNQWND